MTGIANVYKNDENLEIAVIISFLKRERDRIGLFVPKRYCVPTRTFLAVFRSVHDVLLRLWAFFIVYIYYSNISRTS